MQCSGNGDDDLLGIVVFGHQLALPFTEPDRGLPAAGLDRCGELCQAQWQVKTARGRILIGPGPFDAGMTGLGMPGLGHAALLTARPTGIF